MENSVKIKLQQLFQERNMPLPTYNTFKIDNEYSHVPLFKSILSLHDGTEYVGMSGNMYAGIPGNKNDAETNAALFAHRCLEYSTKLASKMK